MTPKQAIFYGEYIKDGNGTRAAIAAGFPVASAHVAASRMLKNAKVAEAIESWRKRQCVKLEITAERTLQEIAKLAFYDPGKLYDKDGKRIPVHQLDDFTRAAVSSIEDETQETLGDRDDEGIKPLIVTRKQRVKMADKGSNLERLGKHLGLFGDSTLSASVSTGPSELSGGSEITVKLVRPA